MKCIWGRPVCLDGKTNLVTMLEHLAVSNTPCISVVTLCNHVLWRSCSLLHRARKAKACARVWLDVYRGIEWVVIVSIVFGRESRSDEINTRVVFGGVMIQKNRVNGITLTSSHFENTPLYKVFAAGTHDTTHKSSQHPHRWQATWIRRTRMQQACASNQLRSSKAYKNASPFAAESNG